MEADMNLQIAPKLKTFTWLFYQSRLLTNVNRAKRHLTLDSCCPPPPFGVPLVLLSLCRELSLWIGMLGLLLTYCYLIVDSWVYLGLKCLLSLVGLFKNCRINILVILLFMAIWILLTL